MNNRDDLPAYVIEQTLHGYSDGHRLVASSCKLPKEAESLMLILSDLSGSGGGDLFDPYLSGYPLESAKCYALACTWPAPEMGRPGCVWTHTLLLSKEFLVEMNNPEELLTLFSRPSSPSRLRSYHSTISIPQAFREREPQTSIVDDWTASIGPFLLQAIYEADAPFAVLTVPGYSFANLPFLNIWRLQWPSLRYGFSFCGGVRAVRTIEGRPMTIQAAIDRDVRRLDRGVSPPAIVSHRHASGQQFAEWINIAAEAYTSRNNHSLGEFFKRVGDSIPGRTTLFHPTVAAYAILSKSIDPDVTADDLLALTASMFSSITSELEFKSAFFGLKSISDLPEITIIRALARTKSFTAFDPSHLQLRQRSALLWSSGSDALTLMFQLLLCGCTPLSEEILSGLIDSIPDDAILAALDAENSVLEALISRHPHITTTPIYWSFPIQRQSRAARALLAGSTVIQDLMSTIVTASLNAEADPVCPDLVEVFGDRAVPVVLNWINDSRERPSNLKEGWRSALKTRSTQMLEWLSAIEMAAAESATFILSLIDYSKVAESTILPTVIARYLPAIESLDRDKGINIACEAFRVSLNMTSRQGADLAASSLDSVYAAALNSHPFNDAWEKLSEYLPCAYWWQDWDRCDRLRRAVVERYRREQWPSGSLVNVTKDDELFETLVSELRESWSGRMVLMAAMEESRVSAKRKKILLGD